MRTAIFNQQTKTYTGSIMRNLLILFTFTCICGPVMAQPMPDVRGTYEDYPVGMVKYWQARESLKSVQVVVLRDPAGEQEARFSLHHGASLISLRYHGKELLFGHSAGANVEMFVYRRDTAPENYSRYWSAFHPSQGGNSMGVPSTTGGVACNGEKSMTAISMMVDAGVNNSFERNPLRAVWKGQVSDNYPPGYSTPYTIQTDASWVPNSDPNGSPKYYLKLHQVIVNIRPADSGPMEWLLEGAAPWTSAFSAIYPAKANDEKAPFTSETAPVMLAGRYQDSGHTNGFAIAVPTAKWATDNAYILENAEYVKLLYGAVWAAPRHTFAVVLSRPLKGLSAFSFDWYVCAGSWDQAVKFGENTTRLNPSQGSNKK